MLEQLAISQLVKPICRQRSGERTLAIFENVTMEDCDDTVIGDGGNNMLYGSGGADSSIFSAVARRMPTRFCFLF